MIDWQKDVWHIPEFFEMLTQQQEEFDKAITGQIGAKEALGLRGGVPAGTAGRRRLHRVT